MDERRGLDISCQRPSPPTGTEQTVTRSIFSLSWRTSPATALHHFLVPDGGAGSLIGAWLFYPPRPAHLPAPPHDYRLKHRLGAIFKLGRVLIVFPLKLKEKKKEKKSCDLSLTFHFRISLSTPTAPPECATCCISGMTPTFSSREREEHLVSAAQKKKKKM